MPIYEGTENYIFISYAHKDSDMVLPMISHMQEQGFRVWFDSGVEAGTEWPEYIAEHLENAAVVLVLMSNAATASRNCRDEINFALDMGKDMLVVHLEEAKLTAGMRLRLSAIQAMFRYRSKTEEGFLEELCKTKLLQCCRVQVTPSPAAVEIEEEVAAAPVTPPPVAPKTEETPDELCARGDRCYAEGNFEEAANCYRKAAGLGHGDALAGLARCYYNGNGVAQDHDEAFDLYAEAAEKGHEKAKGKVQEIEESRKKKASSTLPEGFELRDSRSNTVDLMEYMMSLSKEAGKRRYECPKCKVGLWSTDYHNSEPCPKCGTMIPKR